MESWRLHETIGQNGTEQKHRIAGDYPSRLMLLAPGAPNLLDGNHFRFSLSLCF